MTFRRLLPMQSQIFFLAVLIGMFALIWLVFKPFVIFMVTGVFVAVLALPIDKMWERIFPNRVSAFMTMFTLLVIITGPLVGLGFALAGDAQELTAQLEEGGIDGYVDDALNSTFVQDALADAYPNNSTDERNATVLAEVEKGKEQAIDLLATFVTDMVKGIPDFFIGMTVILFVVYYVLTDGERLVRYLQRALPLPAKQVTYILSEGRNGLRGVFVGQILTSVIQGALGGVGFLIAGLPGAIIWAAVMAILSLLPVIGAFLVWVPGAIFLLATGDIWQGVFLIIWGVVVVSQIDNFIKPKLIGDRADIHPIFVLIGVLGGVAAFGFIGLFLGPLVVGVTISILKVWEQDYLDPQVGAKDPTVEAEPPAPPKPAKGKKGKKPAT